MIKTFRHKGLERFFDRSSKAGINPSHAKRLRVLLITLDAATVVDHLALPGAGLHPLTGELAGHWALSVSGNWRITFRMHEGDAYDVDYLDYH